MKCNLFPFFFVIRCGAGAGGGDFGSGSGSKFNCAARVGSGQTISGTGRVRASVLNPCRPLHGGDQFMALLMWYGSPGFFDSFLQLICLFWSLVSHFPIDNNT